MRGYKFCMYAVASDMGVWFTYKEDYGRFEA